MDKNTKITPRVISNAMSQHFQNVDRLENLYNYYKGENTTVMARTQTNPNVPNNKVPIPNGYYIVTVANGFTFANPLTYFSNEANIDNLLDELKKAKIASHDSELGEDISIFGVSYELIHMSEAPNQHVKLNNLSPLNTFVVYSNGIDKEPMFAVHFYESYDIGGNVSGYELNVYDSEYLTVYHLNSQNGMPTLVQDSVKHYAGQVPIVQYKNNDEALGDFERVIPLIDALDILTSDRINDKEQFINAIMVVYGAMVVDDCDEEGEFMQSLRKYKIMQLPDTNARIEYLKQSLNETDVETLKRSLVRDISKYSLVPELTDENFGTSSGIALEYKTLGLQWLANCKKRMFQKSLTRRLQIMAEYMGKLNRGFNWEDVDVKFNNSLPTNTVEYLNIAKDVLSDKTIIAFLADKFGVTDVDSELEQKQEQDAEKAKMFNNSLPFGE